MPRRLTSRHRRTPTRRGSTSRHTRRGSTSRHTPPGPKPHEGLAIAALVLGILAACSLGWFVPGAILAIIFGAIAWRNGVKAKWGFWLGIVSLVAFVVWIIAIAVTANNANNANNAEKSLNRSYSSEVAQLPIEA